MRIRLFSVLLCCGAATCQAGIENTVIAEGLNDPMEMAEMPDGDLLVIEREGRLVRVRPSTGGVFEAGHIEVVALRETDEKTPVAREDGLLGLALDPHFEQNRRLFVYYSHPTRMVNLLSRFEFKNGRLNPASELVLLEVPVDRKNKVCHQAGCLGFDSGGLLYLSLGDNTNPFESGGTAPIDDRKERQYWDAMRSAGNTNDLRGKILRLRPTEKGYEIPAGNLFPPGTAQTRPEIYVMGCRNPFRFSIDSRSGTLYWGEVGPDANDKSAFGPRGYDEVNQARKAGNFGWPFVIADNQPYARRDFTVKEPGALQDPMHPENSGSRNTGLRVLPAAVPAFIWYPYAASPEFPAMGSGGRNAMAGPVFYFDPARKWNLLSGEADRSLFVYDWMRGRIWTAKLSADEKLEKLEPWLSGVTHPIDLKTARDGSLWLLEYGKQWYFNRDGRVRRLRPQGASAAPELAAVALPEKAGFEVTKLGADTTLRWWLTRGAEEVDLGTERRVKLDPALAGIELRAVATTAAGGISVVRFSLIDPPKPVLGLQLAGKPAAVGFGEKLGFKVTGRKLDATKVVVRARYIAPTGHDAGGPELPAELTRLATERLCLGCHQVDKTSVGPSYLDVAMRHANEPAADKALVAKIRAGGVGVWGAVPMPAQAVPEEEAARLVAGILGLAKGMVESRGAAEGSLSLPVPVAGQSPGGAWEFTAEAPGLTSERLRLPAK